VASEHFLNEAYQRHNRRRQEHLATLGLPLAGCSVLEVGAGIGDHTSFFLDRGCRVTSTDARDSNVAYIRERFPSVVAATFDVEDLDAPAPGVHDVVYCYGLLYHLADPDLALRRLATLTGRMLLLETCVSFGEGEHLHPLVEDTSNPTQSARGTGCRPTRSWVFNALRRRLPFAYATRTQPWHEEFPLDWTAAPPVSSTGLYRAVFVASREALGSASLVASLPAIQARS
jgi:SAM-dependent methyltransferase